MDYNCMMHDDMCEAQEKENGPGTHITETLLEY